MEPFYHQAATELDINLSLDERPLVDSNLNHSDMVKRISAFYKAMLKDQAGCKPVWKPAGEWKNYNDEKKFLYDSLENEDHSVAEDYLRNFWRNQLGLIVKEYARFEDLLNKTDQQKVDSFLYSMKRNFVIWKDLFDLPANRLALDVFVGNPWGTIIEDTLITPKAIRFHTNALQIKNLLKDTPAKSVGEIGAGYGALCYYLNKEITGLTYTDFDLPETLVLAAYNLLLTYGSGSKKIYLYGESELDEHTLSEYDILLLPNFMIDRVRPKMFKVFFNSFSLSEMPPETNQAYLSEIHRISTDYFLHNNMDRSGVINRGFERIPASRYPISPNQFSLLYKGYDAFHAHNGDYKEFLYKIEQ